MMFTHTIQLTNIVCCYDAIRLHLEYFKGIRYTSTDRGVAIVTLPRNADRWEQTVFCF